MLWAVDRIEGDTIVLTAENGAVFTVPQSVLPEANEGDVYRIERDEAEKQRRLTANGALLASLLTRK